MSAARFITSLVPAAFITGGLVFIMHTLISQNFEEPGDGDEYKIPDITMPQREISTEYDTSKPDKPEEVDEPPPELPEPEFENPNVDVSVSIKPNLNQKLKVGGLSGFSSDGDYLPIVKPQPKYPSRAASRGIEGYCTVEYTVTVTGETRDVTVVDCPQSVFASASVRAAEKFKYKPKVIDGEPIEVPGVRNRFTFQLAE
ncbi:hypothetical protein TDB9533_02986 [Thalassocella blandensis]|nr:hypothetical protein TDB9533_02986 [Thalassocella blandensis]